MMERIDFFVISLYFLELVFCQGSVIAQWVWYLYLYLPYVYKLDAYAVQCQRSSVAQWAWWLYYLCLQDGHLHVYMLYWIQFNPGRRQYASGVPCPCGLMVVKKLDIACTELNRQ